MTVAHKKNEEAPAVVKMTGDLPPRTERNGAHSRKDWRQYDNLWSDSLIPSLRTLTGHKDGLTTTELNAALADAGMRLNRGYSGQVMRRLRNLGLVEECGAREVDDVRMGKRLHFVYKITDLGRDQVRWFEANPAVLAMKAPPKGA